MIKHALFEGSNCVSNHRHLLPLLLLVGLWALDATGAQAQVQIEQVRPASASQSSLVGTPSGNCTPTQAECDALTQSDILALLPAGTPSVPGMGPGNRAVVVQRGTGNTATVEQGPGDGIPGEDNLAVIVQDGSYNATTIRQRGRDNLAGIKLVGNSNGITLEQTGRGNEYLLDFTGSGLGSTGSSTTHQVSQLGRNNQLVQVGENSMPFNVRQRGDGMRMVIRHRPQ